MTERDLEHLLRSAAVLRDTESIGCPDELAIAGYVDGGLAGDARESLERHLACCAECSRLVGFLSRAAAAPAPRRLPEELRRQAAELVVKEETKSAGRRQEGRRWAALAAGLLLVTSVVLWNLQEHDKIDENDQTRLVKPTSEGPEIRHPVEGSTVSSNQLWIRWSPEPPSLFYEVRLVDGDGDLLWQEQVAGTEILLPPDLGLVGGEDYFVRVSANLPGGKTLKSLHVGFRVQEGQ